MATKVLLLATIVLLLTILFLGAESQTFDHFFFVQQWPPTTCQQQQKPCFQPPPATFKIHGLWPQKGPNSVVYCNKNFDRTQISSLENQLDVVWPDVVTGNNTGFWEHEWNKHGSCSESQFNQTLYFQTAINMMNKVNLLKALGKGGITSDERTKSSQTMQKVLLAQFGNQPFLRCKKVGQQFWLLEIVMCFKDDGVTMINCQPSKVSCPPNFIF
uniref:Ribonuclease (RNase LC2) n=1 Tax=Luffa aegyptiaca TaxID=3670 RepID=Q40116_LUFAE|nr:ribonuclease (RNase LC2) [Luffa aegyptiaca]